LRPTPLSRSGSGSTIRTPPTPEKLQGLHNLLARDGEVRFKNGSLVKRTGDASLTVLYGRHKPYLEIVIGRSQLAIAWEWAMYGFEFPPRSPKAQPKPRDFGGCPF
jgi:hypothetical protein